MTENEVVQLVTEKKPLRKPFEETRFGEHDDFDREIIADNIIKLLDSDLLDCYPMAIDGGWGTGKSEFCHKLINKMRDNAANYKPRNVIYFDAFEAENVEEPLLSLLAKITEVVPEAEKKAFITKIVPVVKYGLGVTLKGLANHLARQNGDTLSEGFQDAFADGAKSGIDRLLKEYSQAKSHLKILKDNIEQAAKAKELVIFVDELDRCRPDFALNVFELVKHIFDIEGVKFIFVFNSEQIKSMIKNRYGADVDGDIYIEKFIRISINLPSKVNFLNGVESSIRLFAEEMNKLEMPWLAGKRTYEGLFINEFILKNNISLRGINKIVYAIKVYNSLHPENHINSKHGDTGWRILIIFSILCFCFDKNLSRKIFEDNVYSHELFNFLNIEHKIEDDKALTVLQLVAEGLRRSCRDGLTFSSQEEKDFMEKIDTQFRMLFDYRSRPRMDTIFSSIGKILLTLNFCG